MFISCSNITLILTFITRSNRILHKYFTVLSLWRGDDTGCLVRVFRVSSSYQSTKSYFRPAKIYFSDAIGAISIGLAIMPIIAFLSLISLGKNFAKKNHYQVWGSCCLEESLLRSVVMIT